MWFYHSESGFIPYYKLLHPVCFVHKGRNNIWTDFYNATSSNQGMMFSKYQGLIKETHKCSSSIIPSNALLVMVLILLFCKTLENTHTLMSSHTSHLGIRSNSSYPPTNLQRVQPLQTHKHANQVLDGEGDLIITDVPGTNKHQKRPIRIRSNRWCVEHAFCY